ncbi:MAG: winged helix-turn-helix transcriptional regulator [Desulfobacteraceae bacterium]|nr:winged helix-turn-helix transcriptional regulator [Desulfobacteraceae bacterium]
MNSNFIEKIRSYNRFYTLTIGLISKKFLDSNYSLVQARILFELSKTSNICAKDLVNRIGLDPAYLSKILKKFEKEGLLTKRSFSNDSRKLKLSLTQEGQNVYSSLREVSNKQISFLIENLSNEQKRILVDSMETIEKILICQNKNSNFYLIRSHRPGDIPLCQDRCRLN